MLHFAKPNTQTPPYEVSDAFNGHTVAHGFFGCRGGVSQGCFSSLNAGLGKQDDGDHIDAIYENRRRIAGALGLPAGRLVSLRQEHTNKVYSLREPWQMEARPVADAFVTGTPGLGLGILTADCAPVLFYAPTGKGGVIGAAHAGNKGARTGILEATVMAMEEVAGIRHDRHDAEHLARRRAFRESMTVVIGPCIAPGSYEVDKAFAIPFVSEDPAAMDYFRDGGNPDKYYMDLPGYCTHRLKRAGVKNVTWIGHDTLAGGETYFSYRRRTLKDEPRHGLQMSVISLKNG